jgi:hypothetical protein
MVIIMTSNNIIIYRLTKKLFKYVLILLFLGNILYANDNKEEYRLDPIIIDTIKEVEGYKINGVFDEYIISINTKKDKKRVKELGFKLVNNRVLKCFTEKYCVYTLNELIKNKITNLDIGSYQLNYTYYKMENLKDYFIEKKTRVLVENIIIGRINKYGYNWYAIAGYHNLKKKYNEKYQKIFKSKMEKLMKERTG